MYPDVEGYGVVKEGEIYHESAFFDPKVAFANAGVVPSVKEALEAGNQAVVSVVTEPTVAVDPKTVGGSVKVVSVATTETEVTEESEEVTEGDDQNKVVFE